MLLYQLKAELRKRSNDYLKSRKTETEYRQVKSVDTSIDHLFSNAMSKVSKRNIQALGKVNFSAKVDN